MSEVEALRDEITALEAAKQLILQKLISERSSVLRKDKEVQQAKQQCDFISAEYKHLESENALLRTSVAELESDLGAARSSLQVPASLCLLPPNASLQTHSIFNYSFYVYN